MGDFKYSSPLRCLKSSTPSNASPGSKSGFSNPNFVNFKNQTRDSPTPDFIPFGGGGNSPQKNFGRRFPTNLNSSGNSLVSGRSGGFSSPQSSCSSPSRSPYNRPSFNRGRNSDFGGNRGNFRNNFRPRMDRSRNDVDISQYFHWSMVGDPWTELERPANGKTADCPSPLSSPEGNDEA